VGSTSSSRSILRWNPPVNDNAKERVKQNMNQQDIFSNYSKRIDTDRDGVSNYNDCRPLDPTRQHIKPNITTLNRLKKIPLYVTDENPNKSYKAYHISSKLAKTKAPKAVKEVYAIFKRYPNILGKIERIAPERVNYFSYGEGKEGIGFTYLYKHKSEIYKPEPRSSFETVIEKVKRKRIFKRYPERLELKLQELKEYPKKRESINIRTKKQRRVTAGTFGHELTHIKQQKRYGFYGAKQLYEEYEYNVNPLELEAEEAERKLLRDIEKKNKHLTPKAYKKILRL